MKLRYFLILVLIVMLTTQCLTQRGGGRSRSRSRSSFGRSYSRSSGPSLFSLLFGNRNGTNSTNSTEPHIKIQKYNKKWNYNKDDQFTLTDWAVIFGTGGIVYWVFFYNKRKEQIKTITEKFQKNNVSVCSMTEKQVNKVIEEFKNKKWKVVYKIGQRNYTYSWNLKTKNITKKSKYLYEIEAVGYNDENGDSTITGILMFKNNKLSICFDKLHNDRMHAGQTGDWDLLIYEGHQECGIFEGRWYYKGFENNSKYSGSMQIVPI